MTKLFGDNIVRDSRKRVICPGCGRALTNREETYCAKHPEDKVLCYNCQKNAQKKNEQN